MTKEGLIVVLVLWSTPLSAGQQTLQEVIEEDTSCVSTAIYHEARGEHQLGQVAVGKVILNRLKAKHFPKTWCAVVYQPKQFTDVEYEHPNKASQEWAKAQQIATGIILGLYKDPTHRAQYYYAHTRIRKPHWAYRKQVTAQIGSHTFLR